MAKCVSCGKDTILYSSGVPVCVECDQRDEERLKKKPADSARLESDNSTLKKTRP
jgi:hypothetical protein